MNALDQVIADMDFNFLGAGDHAMSVDGVRKVLGNDHFVFLDIRTDQEVAYTAFPFAVHIPLHELPHRLDELPRDKCIVAFCSSVFRGAVAYTYLMANGFDEVKGLTASMEELVKIFKPGPLAKM
ncbi:rhodanese-like domain-containing protein [Desulfoluna spongiiphila]|uniref:rhodanese-like domain-containing protein n=1 Tax=Desulfoluna spongiiphila TaxID=419481 RepID=UPI0012548F25|nr:rhodanese-like domain-containing protein [Desulfoluna spongiiphila]VVS92378.1 rhodanese-like domain [Desulfoluna spongiiphila]